MVKFKNGFDSKDAIKNDLTQIEIVLTDFGMADPDSKGGTPIFASPECFERKDKKSDIFSFGRVILFLLLAKKDFVKWLFVPLTYQKLSNIIQIIMLGGNDQSFNLVSQMTSLTKRIDLQAARKMFDRLRRRSKVSLSHDLVTGINSVVNADLSNDNEVYVTELCDFRYCP